LEFLAADGLLPPTFLDELPEIGAATKADLLFIQPLDTYDQRDGMSIAREDHPLLLRLVDTAVQRGILHRYRLHRISSVVLCGGLCRIARTVTRASPSSTS